MLKTARVRPARTRTTATSLLAVGLAAALILSAGASGAAARGHTHGRERPRVGSTTATIRVVDNNISGAQVVNGGGNSSATNIGPINNFLAANSSTDVVTLQEVCWDQVYDFLSTHNWYWSYDWDQVNKAPDANGQNYCDIYSNGDPNERYIGELITSPYPLGNVQNLCLEYDGSGNREASCNNVSTQNSQVSLGCVDVGAPQGTFATCTTHLPANGVYPTNLALAAIRTFLYNTYIAHGRMVVLTGDLNIKYDDPAMDSIYRQGTNGQFNRVGDFFESDQTDFGFTNGNGCGYQGSTLFCRTGKDTANNGTYSRKIDYIFAPVANVQPRIAKAGSSVLNLTLGSQPYSEHSILKGVLKINL